MTPIAACMAALLFSAEPTLGVHPARFSPEGTLLPWTPFRKALSLEMAWYKNCPLEGKYHRSVAWTFMDGSYQVAKKRTDTIPAMQCGTGILSYLAYDRWTGHKEKWVLQRAEEYADFLLQEASTPNRGEGPLFPRSTGHIQPLPNPETCGSQQDHPLDVEPDKGALAGFAMLQLAEATGKPKYRKAAIHIARVLAAHQSDGDATRSPWPFRVNFVTGEARGSLAAQQTYALALFDDLARSGEGEFVPARDRLWKWIKTFQIPSASKDGALWVQFHEDYDLAGNRNSWSASNLAKLLLKRKSQIDPDWLKDAKILVDFDCEHFLTVRHGVTVCGEQDDDKDPWGGANTNFAAAVALCAKASGDPAYRRIAEQALCYAEYAISPDGCPGQTSLNPVRGGWQEDAHTDVIWNFIDALEAFPEWADAAEPR